ncbi:MAG: MoxR family ATPase [Actinomycetia bacterium]|nr:MoxR family ATPase [Actinomycetes bacterium]MCP3909958.1 MoxR family ATPase [Actinomycetes bacterium]MCP4085535.1 MoxR family ATPase [Actinomycetes bacterium]
MVLSGLLADGHILLEDVPGVAKTLIARSLATVTGLDFSRIQFTPDLIPSDLTGSVLPDDDGRPHFVPGPLFANLVLGDEINRSPSKTQAAALEAMEERQVTVDGHSHQLPRPYLLIATQNPVETEGTYPLPEAQLDRFLLRLRVGYPEPDHERELLRRRFDRGTDQPDLDTVTDPASLRRLQATVETVEAGDDVVDYAVRLVEATRTHTALEIGASPRGSLALVKVARARAALTGRRFATPDDVKNTAISVLSHRLVLRTEAWVRGVREDDVVQEVLDEVPTPTTLTDADRERLNT